jgi:hypothetical protein
MKLGFKTSLHYFCSDPPGASNNLETVALFTAFTENGKTAAVPLLQESN